MEAGNAVTGTKAFKLAPLSKHGRNAVGSQPLPKRRPSSKRHERRGINTDGQRIVDWLNLSTPSSKQMIFLLREITSLPRDWATHQRTLPFHHPGGRSGYDADHQTLENRHRVLNETLSRYSFRPRATYRVPRGEWAFGLVPDEDATWIEKGAVAESKSPENSTAPKSSDYTDDEQGIVQFVKANAEWSRTHRKEADARREARRAAERITTGGRSYEVFSEGDLLLSILRLAEAKELDKIVLCKMCQRVWIFKSRKNRNFCDKGCRENFYVSAPDYSERKRLNQSKYRKRLKDWLKMHEPLTVKLKNRSSDRRTSGDSR